MNNKHFSLALILSAGILWSCGNNNDRSGDASTDSAAAGTPSVATGEGSTATTTVTLDTMDQNFAMKAASGGMAEVQLGNLAMQNASSQRVKDFASMMIRDHSKANDELKTIASGKNVTLPAEPLPEHKHHIEMLNGKTGKAFDKAYMTMMVTEHKKDVSEFEKASGMCKDNDVKSFASKTLPVLQGHLDSAQAIHKTIK